MTFNEMKKIKEYARNLGYSVRDNTNDEKCKDAEFKDWQYIVCIPNSINYEAIIDYSYDEPECCDIMWNLDVFFEQDQDIRDDLIGWHSSCINIKEYSYRKMRNELKNFIVSYKERFQQERINEINKDFEN